MGGGLEVPWGGYKGGKPLRAQATSEWLGWVEAREGRG